MKKKLTIALAKGFLIKDTIELLSKAGIQCRGIQNDSRCLIFDNLDDTYNFLMVRPTDVPVYVAQGAADLGIVGYDILLESEAEVARLLDLQFGYCRLVVAAPQNAGIASVSDLKPFSKVATKFVNITEGFFQGQGLPIEIIKLYGSIELAPLVGLSDVIVDLVATGATLKENGMEVIAEITPSTASLIANPVSYHLNHEILRELTDKLQPLLAGERKLSAK